MTGGSACSASLWVSSSGVACKSAGGVGGPSVLRIGLPVVVTAGLQRGSRTDAWSYDVAVVSSVGGLTNGPTSGHASVTVVGVGFGVTGRSVGVRIGRALEDASMTGGSACSASL